MTFSVAPAWTTAATAIDAPSGAAVDQVRVFPLQNATATDLAAVLRDAIQGGTEISTGQGNSSNSGGGQSGGSSGSSNSGGRASALQFRQIGGNQQRELTLRHRRSDSGLDDCLQITLILTESTGYSRKYWLCPCQRVRTGCGSELD